MRSTWRTRASKTSRPAPWFGLNCSASRVHRRAMSSDTGMAAPIEKQFSKGVDIYEVQALMAHHVARE